PLLAAVLPLPRRQGRRNASGWTAGGLAAQRAAASADLAAAAQRQRLRRAGDRCCRTGPAATCAARSSGRHAAAVLPDRCRPDPVHPPAQPATTARRRRASLRAGATVVAAGDGMARSRVNTSLDLPAILARIDPQ